MGWRGQTAKIMVGRTLVKSISHIDGTHRLHFWRDSRGTFSYSVEWLCEGDEYQEPHWSGEGILTGRFFDSLATADREARGNEPWFRDAQPAELIETSGDLTPSPHGESP